LYVPRSIVTRPPKKSLDNQYTNMIPSVMLSRQTTLPRPLNPSNSFAPIGLQPLVSSCPSFCEPHPLFSITCSLFCKNTRGVGTPTLPRQLFASHVICALCIPNGFTGCATWRLYPPSPQSIAHTSRHHGGCTPSEVLLLTNHLIFSPSSGNLTGASPSPIPEDCCA
jgi:hypothetical protein